MSLPVYPGGNDDVLHDLPLSFPYRVDNVVVLMSIDSAVNFPGTSRKRELFYGRKQRDGGNGAVNAGRGGKAGLANGGAIQPFSGDADRVAGFPEEAAKGTAEVYHE